jgi:hypothetical protein
LLLLPIFFFSPWSKEGDSNKLATIAFFVLVLLQIRWQ